MRSKQEKSLIKEGNIIRAHAQRFQAYAKIASSVIRYVDPYVYSSWLT